MNDEDLEARRRRALYRATRRGSKEMDITLGRYAAAVLGSMSAQRLADFERLLALPDPELQGMVLDPQAFSAGEFAELIAELRAFHGLGTPGI